MKFFMLAFLLFFSIGMSQELHAFQIIRIATQEFGDLDEMMVSQYGFERVRDIEEPDQRVYKNNSDEAGELMVITVIRNAKSCSNAVSIVDGSAVRTAKLRDELPALGYTYAGKKKMPDSGIPVSLFVRAQTTFSITDRVTGTGAYQVVLACKQAL